MAMPDLFISSSGRDGKTIDFLNQLFWTAAEENISDIQLRFYDHLRLIRVEKVGDRVEPFEPWAEIEDRDFFEQIDSRLRSRAHIDAAARQVALDGKIRLRYRQEAGWPGNRTLDIRVSIIPTDAGQTYVCRIQDAQFALKPIDEIAMSGSVRRVLESLLTEKQGVVVVCGPTGSGKTTLLFSLLLEFLRLGKNIKTIEHPPEYIVDGIDQVAVSNHLSFADAIRAFMRQRPHVILVGEVRDAETAEVVAQAGNTGHIVFCTTHSDDSASVVGRFVDLGMQRETVAQSLRVIVAQRLVDSVKPNLPEDVFKEPSEMSRYWLSAGGIYHPADRFPVVPRSEMQGKLPIFELIQVTPEVRAAIRNPQSRKSDIFEAAAIQPQFETLAECAVRLAREGKTTLAEVQSKIGESVVPVHSQRIDKLLINEGLITPAQGFEAIETQAERRAMGQVVSVWETILDLGFADLRQIVDAVGKTPDAAKRLGYYREHEILTQEQIERVLNSWDQANHKISVFTLLNALEHVSNEKIYVKALLYYRATGLAVLQ